MAQKNLSEIGLFFGDELAACGIQYTLLNRMGLEYESRLVPPSSNYNELMRESLYQLLLAQNHADAGAVNKDYLAEDVCDFFFRVGQVHGGWRNGVPQSIKDVYQPVTWNNLSEDVRKFYQSMLKVVPAGLVGGAQDVTEIQQLVASGSYNVQLAKTDDGNTLFCSLIPFVPDEVKGWVENGVPQNFNNNPRERIMFLQDLYKCGYLSPNVGPANFNNVGSCDTTGRPLTSTRPVASGMPAAMPPPPPGMPAGMPAAIPPPPPPGMPAARPPPAMPAAPGMQATNPIGSLAEQLAQRALQRQAGMSPPPPLSAAARAVVGGPAAAVGGYRQVTQLNHLLNGFNLNVLALIENTKQAKYRKVPAPKAVPSTGMPQDDCDDLNLYDLVSNVVYGRDDQGLYRMENGNKVRPQLDVKNCLGNNVDCDSTVATCLLSGNPSTLAKCLDSLKSEQMFAVAQSEINKLHPSVLENLLNTFGFKIAKHNNGQFLPTSFEDWKKVILPSAVSTTVQNAILKNEKLMAYLRAVVNIIRSNPIVLQQNAQMDVVGNYAKKAGLKPFVQPVFTSSKGKNFAEQGVLLSGPSFLSPLALNLPNVMSRFATPLGMPMGMGMGMPGFMMGGDAPCVNAELLSRTFNNLYSQMERSGKSLVEEDKRKVENAINRVAKLENELNRLMDDVKLYTRLNETLNFGSPVPVNPTHLQTIVDDARSHRADISNSLVSLTDGSNRTLAQLTTLVAELVTKVIPALNSVLGGRVTQHIVPAY